MKRISVLLADDHQIVREGFRSLLGHERDLEVVGEAANGREAVHLTRKLHPEVIVMDIAMPMLNGLEATRQICKALPATRVLILSAHSDDVYVDQAIDLGAAGFLLKQTSAHVLASAIRTVHQGNTYFAPEISKQVRTRRSKSGPRTGNIENHNFRLSSREMEVLQLIAEGMSNKRVAEKLGVSFKTVDKHRQHLMGKLDIHDIAGLTRYAIAKGITVGSSRVASAG